ncbi:hypothetical protein M3Y99_01561500 [Aphelenchoides fujianensis]|nr:hypothetical protein M3Y99_01561500 [Aphelenchoides fujianensis]
MVQSGMASDERAAFLEKVERRISSTISVTISEGRQMTIGDLALRYREDWGQDFHRDVLCPLQLQDTYQLLRLFPRFVVIRGCVQVHGMSEAAAKCCDTIRQSYANGKGKGEVGQRETIPDEPLRHDPARPPPSRFLPIARTSAPVPLRDAVAHPPHSSAIWLARVRRAGSTNVPPPPAPKPPAQKAAQAAAHPRAGRLRSAARHLRSRSRRSRRAETPSRRPRPPNQPLLQPKVEPIVKQEEKPPVVNGFQTVLPAPKKEGGHYLSRLMEELDDVMPDYESPSGARLRPVKSENVAFSTKFIQSPPKPARAPSRRRTSTGTSWPT